MKKSRGFINFNCDDDDVYQEESYWDEILSEEDTTHTEKGTGRKEPSSKAARKKARKSIRKIFRDDLVED